MLRTQNSKLGVLILGAGVWGTTLASLATANGHNVRVWSRRCSQSLAAMLEGVDIVLSAVSMKGVRAVVTAIQSLPVSPSTIFVTATKGLDPATMTPSQIWQEAFPTHPVVVLCGPNLSKEIQQGLPAATVVASTDDAAAVVVQRYFPQINFGFIPILTLWE